MSTSRPEIVGDKFVNPLYIAGATDMNLFYRWAAEGVDINPILDQRQNAGANTLRVLGMGWPFVGGSGRPDSIPGYWDRVREFCEKLNARGLYLFWCVFAGTRHSMPKPIEQHHIWGEALTVFDDYPNILLQLANEYNHSTQNIDPSQFSSPRAMGVDIIADHGPGLTDAAPVSPYWDFVTWHARRDTNNGRGFTNYDQYEFDARYPKGEPWIPAEGAKPENYFHNPDFAVRMGQHARMSSGGFFHSQTGVEGKLWTPAEENCARHFYIGLFGG